MLPIANFQDCCWLGSYRESADIPYLLDMDQRMPPVQVGGHIWSLAGPHKQDLLANDQIECVDLESFLSTVPSCLFFCQGLCKSTPVLCHSLCRIHRILVSV